MIIFIKHFIAPLLSFALYAQETFSVTFEKHVIVSCEVYIELLVLKNALHFSSSLLLLVKYQNFLNIYFSSYDFAVNMISAMLHCPVVDLVVSSFL